MYDNYSFILEWNELPESFREAKVDDYILRLYKERDDYGVDGLVNRETGEVIGSTGYWLDSDELRSRVDDSISARFPVYF